MPRLRDAGFDDATPRKFWRHRGSRVDHVELASFSTYQAMTLGCPTASLAVRLGVSLEGYGASDDPFHKDYLKEGPKGLRPRESQMPIRGVVCAGSAPPMRRGRWGWEYDWIWKIATPEEAEAAALDLASQLDDYVLEWLGRDWPLQEILALLTQDDASPVLVSASNGSHLFLDSGLPGSRLRTAHLVMAKRALGHATAAEETTT